MKEWERLYNIARDDKTSLETLQKLTTYSGPEYQSRYVREEAATEIRRREEAAKLAAIRAKYPGYRYVDTGYWYPEEYWEVLGSHAIPEHKQPTEARMIELATRKWQFFFTAPLTYGDFSPYMRLRVYDHPLATERVRAAVIAAGPMADRSRKTPGNIRTY